MGQETARERGQRGECRNRGTEKKKEKRKGTRDNGRERNINSEKKELVTGGTKITVVIVI